MSAVRGLAECCRAAVALGLACARHESFVIPTHDFSVEWWSVARARSILSYGAIGRSMLAHTQHGSARRHAAGLLLLFFCGLSTAGIASAGAQYLFAT